MNRRHWLIDRKRDLGLPQLTAGVYLINILSDDGRLGWFNVDGMGNKRPHPWMEIAAFATATREVEESWEFSAIRRLSSSYLEGLSIGSDPMGIPPTGIGGVI